MSKVMEEIASKLGAEAADEFRRAARGMHLLDNSGGSYVRKEKAEAELTAARKELEARNLEIAVRLEALNARFEEQGSKLSELQSGDAAQERKQLEQQLAEAKQLHQAELAALKEQSERDRKALHIRQDLIQAGALDPDLALTALGLGQAELDALTFEEGIGLTGHSDRIKELQESKTFLFNVRSPRGTHITPADKSARPDNLIQEALAQIGYR